MERVWMYTVLTGKMTDLSWPDNDITYMDSDGSMVSESLSLYGDTCAGHRGSDVFPFGLLAGDTDGFTIKTGLREDSKSSSIFSNREALKAFDPRINSLSYVYDTFEWDHCLAEGFDFNDSWENSADTAPQGHRPVFEKGAPRVPLFSKMKEMLKKVKDKKKINARNSG